MGFPVNPERITVLAIDPVPQDHPVRLGVTTAQGVRVDFAKGRIQTPVFQEFIKRVITAWLLIGTPPEMVGLRILLLLNKFEETPGLHFLPPISENEVIHRTQYDGNSQ